MNKVILIGNLGQDPDVRFMPSGDAVANVSLATNKRVKDRETGEKKDYTEWHRLSVFGKLAEVFQKYTRKGSKVAVIGELRTRKWQDKDGQDRYTTEIIVNEMQMLDSKSDGERGERSERQSSTTRQTREPSRQAEVDMPGDGDFDDDIPF